MSPVIKISASILLSSASLFSSIPSPVIRAIHYRGLERRSHPDLCSVLNELIEELYFTTGTTGSSVWITSKLQDHPHRPSHPATNVSYADCLSQLNTRPYIHVIEDEDKFASPSLIVSLEPIGYLPATPWTVLQSLHVLQTKIPVASPDLLGIDRNAGNCLAVFSVLNKSPVVPKILVVPFDPSLGNSELHLIPWFDYANPDLWAMQCSLYSVVEELTSGKTWKFLGAFNSFALFLRGDLSAGSRVKFDRLERMALMSEKEACDILRERDIQLAGESRLSCSTIYF